MTAVDVPANDHDDSDEELTREAVAWYQGAGLLFRSGGLAGLPGR